MELHFCASGGSGGIPYSISQNGLFLCTDAAWMYLHGICRYLYITFTSTFLDIPIQCGHIDSIQKYLQMLSFSNINLAFVKIL